VTLTRVTRRGAIDFLKRRSPTCSEFEPRQVVKEPGLAGAILTSSSCSFSRVPSSLLFFFSHPDLRHRLLSVISHSRPFLSARHSRQVSRTVYPTSITNRNMATRTFVVFQDDPSEPLPTIKTDVSPSLPLIEPTILGLSNIPVTTAEKENLHPVTGARSSAATDSQSKKRKNGILATKLHIPSTTKKLRDSDCRKRKATTSSSSKTLNGSRVTSSGALDLPKVEELVEPEQPCQDKVAQAEVDSKCYDLTVSPLADVSHAFDQVSLSSAESRPGMSRILSPKVKEACLLSFSYIDGSRQKQSRCEDSGISSLKPLADSVSPKTADIASEETLFSTPERKQIYAAFTFTTPSPSSKLRVASHLDFFGDIKFDP
jgi:hypothetical protein